MAGEKPPISNPFNLIKRIILGWSTETFIYIGTLTYLPDALSSETARDIREEGEDDVKSAWPLWVGLHTCYNGEVKGKQYGNMEQILNARLSSDCSLQLENIKMESLVIVDQHATVNLYLSLVHTARHIMGAGFAQRVACVLYSSERSAEKSGV